MSAIIIFRSCVWNFF